MTDVSTSHPENIPYIELSDEGRKISFRRECFGTLKIYRQVNEGEQELLIRKARTPYIDKERFPSGTSLTYTIELEQDNQVQEYSLKANI